MAAEIARLARKNPEQRGRACSRHAFMRWWSDRRIRC